MTIPDDLGETIAPADPPGTSSPSSRAVALPAACALRLLLDQLGNKWSICVLLSLADGPVRFNVLKRSVEGVTQKMLGQTLRRLELNGLVERRAFATTPMRVEYEATELGRTLTPVIRELQAWADGNGARMADARARLGRTATKPTEAANPARRGSPSGDDGDV